jgi:hypothetical protein
VAPPKLSGGRSAWDICDGAEMLEEITLERVYGLSSGDGRGLLGSIASGEVRSDATLQVAHSTWFPPILISDRHRFCESLS